MTTATDARQPEMGLDFDKVWATIQEMAKQIKESGGETDRKLRETAQHIRESSEKTDRLIEKLTRETSKQIGDLGGRFGELAEHLVAPGILKKFNALGYGFTKCGANVMIEDKSLNLALEIDLFLENGDCAAAVEVRENLKADDVKDHMNRMEKLRRYADTRRDLRKFYGAVAGAVIPSGVREFALKKGLCVIAQSGDTMTIDVPEGFKLKAW
jgi:hypothetical protein